MKLYSIETGNFKIDGGAIFGVVPKVLWQKVYPADENNHCSLAMRSLLVVDGDRKVLIDTGIGDKQSAKFFSHYFLFGDDTLEKSLAKYGFTPDDITDVVLSHLHFDHCGGNIKYNTDKTAYELAFKNATHWISKQQWEAAVTPNKREVASFLKENILPIKELGKINFIDKDTELFPGFQMRLVNGHTAGQILSYINVKNRIVVFAADLVPIMAQIRIPYIMSFDMRPEETLIEKEKFINEACEKDYILFFEHDINYECCTLKETEKGIKEDKIFKIEDL